MREFYLTLRKFFFYGLSTSIGWKFADELSGVGWLELFVIYGILMLLCTFGANMVPPRPPRARNARRAAAVARAIQ